MDLLTFVSNLISSGIWPIITLIIVLIFKNNIKTLLNKLSNFSLGSASASFSDDLAKVSHASSTDEEDSSNKINAYTNKENIIDLARVNPELSVIESYRRLESTINDLYKSEQFQQIYDGIKYHIPHIQGIIKFLISDNKLNKNYYNIYMELSTMRDKVVHDKYYEVSFSDAIAYYELINDLISQIEKIKF